MKLNLLLLIFLALIAIALAVLLVLQYRKRKEKYVNWYPGSWKIDYLRKVYPLITNRVH